MRWLILSQELDPSKLVPLQIMILWPTNSLYSWHEKFEILWIFHPHKKIRIFVCFFKKILHLWPPNWFIGHLNDDYVSLFSLSTVCNVLILTFCLSCSVKKRKAIQNQMEPSVWRNIARTKDTLVDSLAKVSGLQRMAMEESSSC